MEEELLESMGEKTHTTVLYMTGVTTQSLAYCAATCCEKVATALALSARAFATIWV